MPEKDPKREEKLRLAIALAEAGDDVIFETIQAKNELWLTQIEGLTSGALSVEEARLMKKEVQDMIDVIEIAQTIQKIRGTDMDSEIRKAKLKSSFGRLNE